MTLLRQAAGTPAGGQFRPQNRTEADISFDGATEEETLLAVATDWGARPADLRELANRPDNPWLVDFHLARNPSTPADALARLAGSSDTQTRQMVAAHQKTSETILAVLSTDRTRDVRAAVAENRGAHAQTRKALADDDDIQVQLALTRNPGLGRADLKALQRSRFLLVREKAQEAVAGR